MPPETKTFQTYKQDLARNPGDVGLLYACCTAGEYEALDETVELVRRRLVDPPLTPELRLNELHLFAHLREKQGRRDAGLSLTNAVDTDDLDFKFARHELGELTRAAQTYLTRHPNTLGAAVLLAESLASAGRRADAEAVLASLRAQAGRAQGTHHVAAVTSFDERFHATLASIGAQVAARLPPFKIIKAVDQNAARIVYTAADYRYFEKYGWDLLDTFAKHGDPGIWLDLHIMDMTPAETEATLRRLEKYEGLRWGLSTEWTNLRTPGSRADAKARGYYHAGRLIRLSQLLSRHPQAAVWMIDTDMLFAADARRLFECIEDCDVVLGLSPGRFEVRNKICLSFTGFAPTPRTRAYVQRVAGYVGHFLGLGLLPWGIDQVAMYAVLAKDTDTPPLRVKSLPAEVCDTGRGQGCVLWPAKPAR